MTKLEQLELENKILRERLARINLTVNDPGRYDDVCWTFGTIKCFSSDDEITSEIKHAMLNAKVVFQFDDAGNEYWVDGNGHYHYTREEG